jgi:hypothetical protein
MLECCAATNPHLSAFTTAFDKFEGGASTATIRTALSTRAPNFVKALKEKFGEEFAMPAPKQRSAAPLPMLQKRASPEASASAGGKVTAEPTEQKLSSFFNQVQQPKR